jgi:predicted lipoprotein with Yx(FWY)xxD motif
MKTRLLRLIALGAVLALGIVTASAVAGRSGPAAVATVKARHTSLGTILTDGRGMTLYLFEKDTRGKSACYGKCAAFWPPLVTSAKPHAGSGARASLIGTTRRTNGKLQVTYAGHPLYFFAQDTRPGQTAGQAINGFGAEWYVLGPNGVKIEKTATSGGAPPPTTTSPPTTYPNPYP